MEAVEQGVRGTNTRLDQTNARLDETNARLDQAVDILTASSASLRRRTSA